jgi:aspartate kinase
MGGMVVLKFGGTSVADTQPILRVASIVARQTDSRVVVVSALAGVTDRLVQVGNQAREGKAEAACGVLDGLVRRHEAVAKALSLPQDAASSFFESLREIRQDVAALLTRAAADHLEAWMADAILAAGELMSGHLIVAAFNAAGIPASWLDPRDVIETNEADGCAVVDLEKTTERLRRLARPVLLENRVPVIGGFVGSTADGRTTTLGRGGSDVTAAVVGVCLDAAEIQIWTDVDGVLAADPRVVPQARCVPQLSFAEAHDLAFFGAKVLHPDTLDFAALRQVPVRVRNSRKPENASGTLVSGSASAGSPTVPVALACRRQATAVVMKPRAGSAASLLEDAMGLVQRTSPQPTLAITLDDRVLATFDDAVAAAELAAGLQDVADVKVERDVAVLAAVAQGLGDSSQAVEDFVAGLDVVTIHALAKMPSGLTLVAVLDDADLPETMTRLYDRYVAAHVPDSAAKEARRDDAGVSDDTALAGASS